MAQAMQYLHDRHFTNKDLKNSNILIRRVSEDMANCYAEGYLDMKLANFGLAKAYNNTSISCRYTINASTPLYLAPKVFGKDLTLEKYFLPKANVWSFGVTYAKILSTKNNMQLSLEVHYKRR